MAILERQLIRMELEQKKEEGCDIQDISGRIEVVLAGRGENEAAELSALYDELDGLQPGETFPYDEPSRLEEICALRPDGPRRTEMDLGDEDLLDRIHGAWLGRAAGCALGKPVEGWEKDRIDSYLEFTNALPLDDYLPYTEDHPDGLILRNPGSSRGRIEYMERDDDMDYPILGLLALESSGMDLTPRKMASVWMSRMPYTLLYTAESAAYRNFVNGLWPPESALYRNPYREWIGAQIRADIFGYVTPGWPEKAAALAFQDACISHVKNGIYGEMFVAAMLSAAFVSDDVEEIVGIGLSEIPEKCRLAEAVHDTLAWCREESDWEKVWKRIKDGYGHYHGVHTINNAALVVMGLYFGASDYETGIVVTVRGGWDTDCNGATVGSILGAKFGAQKLPQKWVGVLNDRLLSAVSDCTDNKISELASRSHQVARKIMAQAADADTVDDLEKTRGGGESPLVGTWALTTRWGSVGMKQKIVVNPDLSGILEDEMTGGTCALENVRSDGNIVSFSYEFNKAGMMNDMSFEGIIKGGVIRGRCYASVGDAAVTGVRN